eukprot:3763697-Rhodomonas_salina.1
MLRRARSLLLLPARYQGLYLVLQLLKLLSVRYFSYYWLGTWASIASVKAPCLKGLTLPSVPGRTQRQSRSARKGQG